MKRGWKGRVEYRVGLVGRGGFEAWDLVGRVGSGDSVGERLKAERAQRKKRFQKADMKTVQSKGLT